MKERKPTAKKTTLASRRYQAWLHADNGLSFIEWLKTDWAKGVK